MPLTGHLLLAGRWQAGTAGNFAAINPADASQLSTVFTKASAEQVKAASAAAQQVSADFRDSSLQVRADFLSSCADEIMALGDELLETMQAETGYPRARCEGERSRTVGQLRMFADYLEQGEYLDARINTAQPERHPLPRPDIRSVNQPLGPVAIFAVSNFPLAFSTAGGDTASALAAGCPVIVKAHPSHPGTGELVAQAIHKAIDKSKLPAAVFSFLQGDVDDAAAALIDAPEVQAIAFTGSYEAGMAITRRAAARSRPIPVFAEMGSINPLVLLPEVLQKSATDIASGLVGSITLGSGQFCVNPGLVLAISGPELELFIAGVASDLQDISAGIMLNQSICDSYRQSLARLAEIPCLDQLCAGQSPQAVPGFLSQAAFFKVSAADFLQQPALQQEVFGPASLLVECTDKAQLLRIINALEGQLTGTVHGTDKELKSHHDVLIALQQRVGRIVINGFPTGVEVCSAMVHGGPFPATTDARFTSVGTSSIMRFVRPVCYQNYPEALLPDALRNANPLRLSRMVNSIRTTETVRD